jgi:Helix-turn-helix domain
MESLGPFLKHGREEAGITLEELAQKTRIRREALECLESEDLENLPTDTYVRGFVKQVCRELGLHPREGLVRYETLRERLGPQDEITWSEEREHVTTGRLQRALEDPERVVRRARRLVRAGMWVGGAAVVLGLAWGGASLVGRLRDGSAEPRVAAATPAKEDSPAPVVEAPAPQAGVAKGGTAEPGVAPVKGAEPRAVEPKAADSKAEVAAEGKPAAGKRAPRKPLELALPLEQVRLPTPNPARVLPDEILVTVKPAESIRDREEAAKSRELASAEAAPGADSEAESAGDAADGAAAPPMETPQESPRESQVVHTGEAQPREKSAKAAAAVPAKRDAATEKTSPAPPPTHASVTPPSSLPTLSAPPRPRRPVAGERLRLEIVALRAVDVQVLLDGIGYPRSTSMEAGEVKVWKADSLFVLHASDGGAVRIILAGDDLGIPGTDHERLERLVIRGDR